MSVFTIANEFFEVTANSYGAQLLTIKSLKTDRQYLWCADESVWGKTSPVLFPYIGRVKDSYIKVGEEVYPMIKHGFARNSEFDAEISKGKSLAFVLRDNDFTRSLYPFDFTFRVKYILTDSTVSVCFTVHNEGTSPMYFALGGHTGFSTEIAGAKLDDYKLVFNKECRLVSQCVDLSKGLLSGEQEDLGVKKELPLSVDAFAGRDTFVFKDIDAKSVKLVSDKHDAVIRVDYTDFPNLAIWAMKGTDRFVCIEPWIAQTDSLASKHTLAKKEGFIRLEGGKDFTASYKITISE